jgi:LCP family protein required for cell wall assembly
MVTLRTLVAAVSALVLGVTGVVYTKYQDLSQGMNTSAALGNAPKSTNGAVNILLMGLDSRKDQNGNMLPKAILDQLHAGDGTQGGYNTNTLILMHVPNNGGKVSAFSIPRDDYVNFVDNPYGQQAGKIKEAYGLAKAAKEEQLAKQGVTDRTTLEQQGREAGRLSTLANVRALTGVPIDHFAEVNLAGFYDLATALGGVDVCLNQAVQDDYSGANFPAGRQTLNGSQALAFVRQRHGLTNGDLDRTHRQQAFLASVAHKLTSAGTFTSMSKLQGLIDAAKKDVVIDSNWNVLTFAQQSQNLTGGNMEFQTLPIKGFDTINGQSVNLIDAAAIKNTVQSTFNGSGTQPGAAQPSAQPAPAPTAGSSTVDVVNASGKTGEAAKLSNALTSQGWPKGTVSNGTSRTTSTLLYGSGAKADADKLASLLGISSEVSSSAVTNGHVQVELGNDFTMPAALSNGTTPQAGPATPTTPDTTANGPQGAPVNGGGIPCVN